MVRRYFLFFKIPLAYHYIRVKRTEIKRGRDHVISNSEITSKQSVIFSILSGLIVVQEKYIGLFHILCYKKKKVILDPTNP